MEKGDRRSVKLPGVFAGVIIGGEDPDRPSLVSGPPARFDLCQRGRLRGRPCSVSLAAAREALSRVARVNPGLVPGL